MHGAMTLIDPPAIGTLRDIVGTSKRFSLGSFPATVAREAMSHVPIIQKQETQTIDWALMFSPLQLRSRKTSGHEALLDQLHTLPVDS
jgi:hypothetical protein